MKTFIAIVACMFLAFGGCCPERNKPARRSETGTIDGRTSVRTPGCAGFYYPVYEWPEHELISNEFGPV